MITKLVPKEFQSKLKSILNKKGVEVTCQNVGWWGEVTCEKCNAAIIFRRNRVRLAKWGFSVPPPSLPRLFPKPLSLFFSFKTLSLLISLSLFIPSPSHNSHLMESLLSFKPATSFQALPSLSSSSPKWIPSQAFSYRRNSFSAFSLRSKVDFFFLF